VQLLLYYDSGVYTGSYFTSCNSLADAEHHSIELGQIQLSGHDLYQSESQWRLLHDGHGLSRIQLLQCICGGKRYCHAAMTYSASSTLVKTMAGGCGTFGTPERNRPMPSAAALVLAATPEPTTAIMDLVPARPAITQPELVSN